MTATASFGGDAASAGAEADRGSRRVNHSASSEIGRKALRLSGLDAEYYMCEEGLGTQTFQFQPDIYVDISRVFERKLELLRCHVCQNREDHMAQSAARQSAFRGCQTEC